MDRRVFASFLALLIVPAALATSPGDDGAHAAFDLFQVVPLDSLSGDVVCDDHAEAAAEPGKIQVAEDGTFFRFLEGNTTADEAGLPDPLGETTLEGPETRVGCAMARFPLRVPDGTGHLHLSFEADRTIDQSLTLDYQIIQQVLVLDRDTGDLLHREDYFPPTEADRDRTRITDIGGDSGIPLDTSQVNLTLVFYFHDTGRNATGQIMDQFASGQVFSAHVWDLQVEYSAVPPSSVEERHERRQESGTRFDDLRVSVMVPADLLEIYTVNLRAASPDATGLDHVVMPDGSRYDTIGSFVPGEEYSGAMGRAVVETRPDGIFQATLPGDIIQAYGPGEYTLVLTQVDPLESSPFLWTVNVVLLLLPYGFAANAFRHVRVYQKAAFGAYERSARNLLITLVLVALYYTAVVVTAAVAGWLRLMSLVPPGWEGALLYMQVALAIAAFVWLWFTSNELYRITKPA